LAGYPYVVDITKTISAQHWTQPKSRFLAKFSHVHLQLGYHNKNQGQVKTSPPHPFLLSNDSPCRQTFFFFPWTMGMFGCFHGKYVLQWVANIIWSSACLNLFYRNFKNTRLHVMYCHFACKHLFRKLKFSSWLPL
jgi:hypothetical protein